MSQWYQENGLSFSCEQCGNCCSGQAGYVWLSWEELEELDKYLQKNNIDHISHYIRRIGAKFSLIEKENGDCIFLEREKDGRTKCQIHPIKPRQCRTWPFWQTLLSSKEVWDEAAQTCPGMNKGKHYSFSEIKEKRDLLN